MDNKKMFKHNKQQNGFQIDTGVVKQFTVFLCNLIVESSIQSISISGK